ncbi:MAG: hypothetical protein GVY19_06615 [Bacteroidetes bacterium]|jgi:hypothetical protein|nr:hypothetical protein [Bacteroidota bacterium]
MKTNIFNKRVFITLSVLVVLILLFTGCAEPYNFDSCEPEFEYGFLNGLWHGFIAPISFIISLFKEDVAMYACNNNGNWYNFGFIFGAMIILGGSHAGKSKK